jgi:hypothetical protein
MALDGAGPWRVLSFGFVRQLEKLFYEWITGRRDLEAKRRATLILLPRLATIGLRIGMCFFASAALQAAKN